MSHVVSFQVPIRLESEANGSHGHWAKRSQHVREQRQSFVTMLHSIASLPRIRFELPKPPRSYAVSRWEPAPELPLVVTITRVAPRRLDDDNATRACKAIRDQLAELLGVDDGNPAVKWVIEQRRGRPHEHAVHVQLATG